MNPLTTGRIHTHHLPPGKLPLAVGVSLSWRFEHPDHLRHAARLLNEEADWLETHLTEGQGSLFTEANEPNPTKPENQGKHTYHCPCGHTFTTTHRPAECPRCRHQINEAA